MAYHNIHAHIFTMNNAPRKFLHLYMPGFAADAIDKITSTRAGAGTVAWLLNKLGGKGGKKYASFLQVGKSASQADVFRGLLEHYEDSSMKIAALTLFMEKLGADASMTGFEGQIEEILTVKKRYPDRLLVFLSLDPRWKETGQEIAQRVAHYFNNRIHVDATRPDIPAFAGLKIYPSTGFYAFDNKLRPTFEWAADHGVPIISHCNYMGGIFNNHRQYLDISLRQKDPYTGEFYPAPAAHHKLERRFLKRLLNTQDAANNQTLSSYFLEPYSYRGMLEDFRKRGKRLKICFAHYGGNHHMKLQHQIETAGATDPGGYFGLLPQHNWTRQIQDLMAEFDSVYTDVSYALTDAGTHPFIFRELTKSYADRILFGTDFFMTEREDKEANTYNSFKKKALDEVVVLDGTHHKAWELMAGANVEGFLQSSFYPHA